MSIRLPEPTAIKDPVLNTYLNQLLRDIRNILNDLETKDKITTADLASLKTRFDEFQVEILS